MSETEEFPHWGQLQITNGGDKVGCRAIGKYCSDEHDNTYIWVSPPSSLPQRRHQLITSKYEATADVMAELADAPPEMEVWTYFGELQQIFSIMVPQSSQLHLNEPGRLFLATVKECNTSFNKDGFWEFTAPRKLAVIDIGTIQCAVGWIFDQGKW